MPKPTYSEDRQSLAREIRQALSSRGFWTPTVNPDGPDLITAVAKMAQDYRELLERLATEDRPE